MTLNRRIFLSSGTAAAATLGAPMVFAVGHGVPHAYNGGSQTKFLKAQIRAMPQGGPFAMVAPLNPCRCPPGPCERVSMVTYYLRANNPTAKVIVADPKAKFSGQSLFQEGWNRYLARMIDWTGNDFDGGAVSVDPAAMTVMIDGEITKVEVRNVIPTMKAGQIAEVARLTDGNRAPVKAAGMSSKADPISTFWAMRPNTAICPSRALPPIHRPGSAQRMRNPRDGTRGSPLTCSGRERGGCVARVRRLVRSVPG